MIVVGITGASGVIYGIRLLKALNELNIENSLIISDAAKTVINHEVKRTYWRYNHSGRQLLWIWRFDCIHQQRII